MRLAIAGTGYVGLVTGVCLAYMGHTVYCVDKDEHKIEQLKNGRSPIYETDLEKYMALASPNISYTSDYVSAYKNADVIFIAVGTPETKDGSANTEFVYNVAKQIAESVEKDCIVVVKSTVPIGTNDKIEAFIKSHLKFDVDIEIASNPEFLAQGTAVRDTLHANRIVLGVESVRAEKILREVYSGFDGVPILVTNRRSAEMIKYASNDFLALKVSYINEIANLCDLLGADIDAVAKGMSYDPRIGDKFLKAGIGYGGSCFPKDARALIHTAEEYGYDLKTVKASIAVNVRQKLILLDKARKFYPSFNGKNIAVLGLTFKPGTDDLREAPSIVNIEMMLKEGANIQVWDPVGSGNFKRLYPEVIKYCDSIDEALTDADICFIFTDWPEIKAINTDKFAALMKTPIVCDGRNCFSYIDKNEVNYISIGRSSMKNQPGMHKTNGRNTEGGKQ